MAKFQSPRTITRPKIIGPEWNINLICNLSLYTHIPNIKSISQSIEKQSGENCFISELRTWVTLYVPAKSKPVKTDNNVMYDGFWLCIIILSNLCMLWPDCLNRVCYKNVVLLLLVDKHTHYTLWIFVRYALFFGNKNRDTEFSVYCAFLE